MALFRRDEPEPPRRAASSAGSRPAQPESVPAALTVIAPESRLQGTIAGTADVLVEGFFEGRAEVDGAFVVGQRGKVQGNLRARVVRIAGSVVGNVEAAERVELQSTGRIEGDVLAPRVAIAEGGFCQGRIEMTRARAAAQGAGGTEPQRAEARESSTPLQTELEGARTEG
jgi:cytoskeletal protein CcmA (bactofilin family)